MVTRCALPLIAGCAPPLDWRQVLEPETALTAQFPCKPQRVAQPGLGLLQCEAHGQRFVLTWRQYADPATQRADLLAQAHHLANRHSARLQPLDGDLPKGALAWEGSGRFELVNGPQGVWIQVWAQGAHVHQAMVLAQPGQDIQPEAAREFFDGVGTRT